MAAQSRGRCRVKLANRYIETLIRQGLQQLWDKYRALPGEVTSPAQFRDELDAIINSSVADSVTPQARDFGILVSDLRGFTPLMEQHPPLDVVDLLNHYYREMNAIIDRHGGVIDKFMGDSIMALFDSKGNPDAPQHLLDCVIDMQLAMDDINDYAQGRGLPNIYMGIGVNYGSVITCELGSEIYRELTVIGDEVNMASRLAAYCLRGQVLMSEGLYAHLKDEVMLGLVSEMHFKGKAQPFTVYEVLGSRGHHVVQLPVRDSRKSYRVGAHLPANYHTLEDKLVSLDAVSAQILDLSLHGARIVSSQPQEYLDEIRIVLPFLAADNPEIYGKVLACRQDGAQRYLINIEFTWLDDRTAKAIRLFVAQRVHESTR
jgi:adenylate cyclase